MITIEGAWRRLVLEFRGSDAMLNFFNARALPRLRRAGVVTPDHTIRTKNWPLVLPHPQTGKLDDFARAAAKRPAPSSTHYHAYFARHNERFGGSKRELDPLPRVVLVPGSACSALAAPSVTR